VKMSYNILTVIDELHYKDKNSYYMEWTPKVGQKELEL